VAEIAKPTYTPSPTLLPSPIPLPTEIPTNTPEAIAFAELVVDTPIAEYVEPEQVKAPVAGSSYGGNKYILVDISEQHMYVYEGDTLVYSFVASTGMNNATAVGNFSVLEKIPNAYGATWNIWMPSWLGIYWAGGLQNGIHALPILPNGSTLWAGYLGVPISYGCVVLGSYEAQLLYDWADVGTPVEIRR
jgi:lipoprotein-anchoring transpeptidase ErfK/SrfK